VYRSADRSSALGRYAHNDLTMAGTLLAECDAVDGRGGVKRALQGRHMETGLLVGTSRNGASSTNQPALTQRPLSAVRTGAKGGEFSNERTVVASSPILEPALASAR
jgi:hypothetical protein